MNTEEIRTRVVWDTSDVDKGLQRVERAADRMDKAEKSAVSSQQARQAESARREISNREKALRDLERMEKESAARRAAATEAHYKRLAGNDRNYFASVSRGLQSNSASARAASAGGGGHGGGFIGNGNNRRMIGDALDAATGSQGWVMRTNQLHTLTELLGGRAAMLGGGALALGGILGKGFLESQAMRGRTNSLLGSIGESTKSPWAEYMTMLPRWMQPENTPGRSEGRSYEGIGAQREEIQEEIKKTQQGRKGFGAMLGGLWGAVTGDRASEESFRAEEKANDKLLDLDRKRAEIIHERTAAQRVAAFQSEHEGALAKNELELKEKIASIDDAANSGKIGVEDRMAQIQQAKSEREIADQQAQIQERARQRANSLSRSETYIRGRGEDVEMRSAFARFNTADSAVKDAHTKEQKEAAEAERDAAWQEYAAAERTTRERKAMQAIDLVTAKNRGNEDERSIAAADALQQKALERLEIAKEEGKDAERIAQIEVERADTARILLEREKAVARIRADSADRSGDISLRGAAAGIGVGSTVAERAQLQAGVESAREQLKAANEIAKKQRYSLESVQAQHRAFEALVRAALSLKQHVIETARVRRNELGNMQTQTAAIGLQNVGRGDRASLLVQRRQSEMDQYEALRDHNPEAAAEIAKQQRGRETGAFLQKYLRPDGRRRRASELHREERIARNRERRLRRASDRLEKNEGLIHVQRDMAGNVIGGMDPLTREHVSAKDLYARKHRPSDMAKADAKEGGEVMHAIRTILDQRLPKGVHQ